MNKPKMILLEFNELCPNLLKRFMEQGQLPNFKTLYESSSVYETDADADGEELNPWIQWVDVHTGVPYKNHQIFRLNELDKLKNELIWDKLSVKYNLKNWVCGSMNSTCGDNFNGRLMPDPWTNHVQCVPQDKMQNVYNFISNTVQNTANKPHVSTLDFGKSLIQQGLRLKTLFLAAKQMFLEKLGLAEHWQRALILDRIQLDIFLYYLKKESPDFSTFFSNCVAHFQHHFWKDFEPQKFGIKNTKQSAMTNAIPMAYKNTDYLLGEILKHKDNETAVVFATALSQEPYIKDARYYYQLKNENSFFNDFDIPQHVEYKPVMAEQFHLVAKDEIEAEQIAKHLNGYVMDSDEYFHVGTKKLFLISISDKTVHVQCRCTKKVRAGALFYDSQQKEYCFNSHFKEMSETKSGKHNPIGMYWFSDLKNNHRVNSDRVHPVQIHDDIMSYYAKKA